MIAQRARRPLILGFLCSALLSVATTSLAAAPAPPCTAFVDVSIVAVDREAITPHRTLVVKGERISSISPAARARIPTGCRRIDGRDRYLIPGLTDSHVHFFLDYRQATLPSGAYVRQLQTMFLANGVTGALVMEGSPALLKLRDEVAAGRSLGPKLWVSGALIQMDDGGLPPGRKVFATTEAVREEVLAEAKAGYDFVKVHGDMTPEGYAVLLRTAKEKGLRVIGHAPPNLDIDATLDGGQALVTHAESYLDAYFRRNRAMPTDPAEIDRMAADVAARTLRRGVWVQPTLSVFRQIGDQVADYDAFAARPALRYMPRAGLVAWTRDDNPYLKNWKIDDVPKLRAQYDILVRLTRALDKAGVPLLAGTDDMVPVQLPGFSMKDELEQLVAAGLTPAAALKTATSNAAAFLRDKDRGTIAPGKIADLVLLSADPLDDVDNVFRQDGTMLRGRWLSQDMLMKALKSGAP